MPRTSGLVSSRVACDDGVQVLLGEKRRLALGQGLEALHHVLDVPGLLGNGLEPGPGGVVLVGFLEEAVAEAPDDVQGIPDAVGNAQGHLAHGALHHQGLHLPVEGENLVAGLLQVVVVFLHAVVEAPHAGEKQSDGGDGHVDDAVDAPHEAAQHVKSEGGAVEPGQVLDKVGDDMGAGEDHQGDGQPVEEKPEGVLRFLGHEAAGVTPGHEGENDDQKAGQVFQQPDGGKRQGDHEPLVSESPLNRADSWLNRFKQR